MFSLITAAGRLTIPKSIMLGTPCGCGYSGKVDVLYTDMCRRVCNACMLGYGPCFVGTDTIVSRRCSWWGSDAGWLDASDSTMMSTWAQTVTPAPHLDHYLPDTVKFCGASRVYDAMWWHVWCYYVESVGQCGVHTPCTISSHHRLLIPGRE